MRIATCKITRSLLEFHTLSLRIAGSVIYNIAVVANHVANSTVSFRWRKL